MQITLGRGDIWVLIRSLNNAEADMRIRIKRARTKHSPNLSALAMECADYSMTRDRLIAHWATGVAIGNIKGE